MNTRLLLSGVGARLFRFKVRTLLMATGLLVGVVAAVVLATVAASLQKRFRSFVSDAFPADSIAVFAGSGPMADHRSGDRDLRLGDLEAVAGLPGIASWDPMVQGGRRDVRAGARVESVRVSGISSKAERVRRRSVVLGEFLSASEVTSRAHVALLGPTTAGKLFPGSSGSSALGAQIFIDGIGFTVEGVLEARGSDPHGNDLDDVVEVPYTTLMDTMLHTTALSGARLLVRHPDRAEEVADRIRSLVRGRHHIAPGQRDDFSVFTSAGMQNLLSRAFRIFDRLVAAAWAVVFLVSALIVLGVLQLGVRARRSEIGLRKAVGARRRDVAYQFLLEALVVAAVASLVGLVAARGVLALLEPALTARLGLPPFVVSPLAELAAVAGALLAGALGASLPARRAARLEPGVALG